ncbi:STAS domain-containing protein [Streptomyces sp. NPDC046887]|uniref:STAS domain-containing protein n=1 Tax=Streptomyces sp. NPDC046887 TaxID=3155472 RepID=UPI0033EDAE6A
MTERTLTVTSRTHPSGATVLTVDGELDHHTAAQLRAAVEAAPYPPAGTVLDLTRLGYCDSTGITVLVTGYHRAQAAGTPLVLAGLSADLLRVFRIVGLDQIFSFRPTVDEALAALSS